LASKDPQKEIEREWLRNQEVIELRIEQAKKYKWRKPGFNDLRGEK
jgi:hypothetical protein